jgi:hypothetical protein
MSPRDVHIHINDDGGRFDDEPEQPPEPSREDMVRVTRAQTSRYTPYGEEWVEAGLSITQIRELLWEKFNLAEGLVAICNGEPVQDSYVTKKGDWVHFNAAPKELGVEEE